MADRKDKTIPIWPQEVFEIIAHFVKVKRRQQVGDAEPLPHVALSDTFRHSQNVPAHVQRASFQGKKIACQCSIHGRWIPRAVVSRSARLQSTRSAFMLAAVELCKEGLF